MQPSSNLGFNNASLVASWRHILHRLLTQDGTLGTTHLLYERHTSLQNLVFSFITDLKYIWLDLEELHFLSPPHPPLVLSFLLYASFVEKRGRVGPSLPPRPPVASCRLHHTAHSFPSSPPAFSTRTHRTEDAAKTVSPPTNPPLPLQQHEEGSVDDMTHADKTLKKSKRNEKFIRARLRVTGAVGEANESAGDGGGPGTGCGCGCEGGSPVIETAALVSPAVHSTPRTTGRHS